MTSPDRMERKRLLLARIALERAELAVEIDRLQAQARPARLLKALAAAALLRCAARGALQAPGWLALLRRPAVASTALGLLTPLLRSSSRARRALSLAAAALGLFAAWRQFRRSPTRPSPPAPASPR